MLRKFVVPLTLVAAAIVPAKAASPSPSPTQAENEAAVLQVLELQQIAWNHGDIDRFMEGYWRSHDIVFISGDTIMRGWQTVHDRYRSKYANPDAMGQLTFSQVEVRLFGYDGALVFGRWRLDRVNHSPHGFFTLVMRKTNGSWKIVHDHTSQSADAD